MSDIPALSVSGRGIAEAWESSVIELYNKGLRYHRSGRKDKGNLQVDSTMMIEIRDIDTTPINHKWSNTYWETLLSYGFELLGAKDSMVVNEFDPPNDPRWPYHYHERIVEYPSSFGKINQLDPLIEKLIEKPNTRQGSIVIWSPEKDIKSDDPPCLQHIWFGLTPNPDYQNLTLNMNYLFRSRNVMWAAPMNMFGFYLLQCLVRDRLKSKGKFNVKNGRIIDYINSYHVSSRDMHLLNGFMKRWYKEREEKFGKFKIEDRMFTREDTFRSMREGMENVKKKIIGEITQRFDERKSNHLDKASHLDELLQQELEKIEGISLYLKGFVE